MITSDLNQFVYLTQVSQFLFTFSHDKQLLVHKSAGCVQAIDTIRCQEKTLCALGSIQVILIISLEPVVSTLLKIDRPQYLKECLPMFSFGFTSAPRNIQFNFKPRELSPATDTCRLLGGLYRAALIEKLTNSADRPDSQNSSANRV